jgi:hypothetical protein
MNLKKAEVVKALRALHRVEHLIASHGALNAFGRERDLYDEIRASVVLLQTALHSGHRAHVLATRHVYTNYNGRLVDSADCAACGFCPHLALMREPGEAR